MRKCLLLVLFFLVAFTGYADSGPVEDGQSAPAEAISADEAKERLLQKGIAFTIENFFDEIRGGRAENVRLFIMGGMDAEVVDKYGNKVLYAAVGTWKIDNAETIRILLDAGANINKRDREDCSTPLMAAIGNQNKEAARLLIERGADISIMDDFHQTPLMTAVIHDDAATAKLLVQKGADPGLKGDFGLTPLSYAVLEEKLGLIKVFKEAGARFDKDLEILVAIQEDNLDGVQSALSSGAQSNRGVDGVYPLALAAKLGRTEIVKTLIERGADPNVKGRGDYGPLALAVENGRADVVRILLESGADPDGDVVCNHVCYPDTPLLLASDAGNLDVVELLIASGANVNAVSVGHSEANPRTPLIPAAWRGNSQIIKALLDAGADPTFKEPYGSVLESAKSGNYSETVRFIEGVIEKWLSRKSGKEAVTEKEKSARAKLKRLGMDFTIDNFLAAAVKGDLPLVALFIEGGVDVNAKDRDGKSALHQAAHNKRVDVAALLIKNGSRVNDMDFYGKDALAAAAEKDDMETVSLLLEKGADPNASCWALVHAAKNGNEGMVKALLSRGADVNSGKGCKFKAYAYYGGALVSAAQNGRLGVVKTLIKGGANLEAAEEDPFEGPVATALMYAAEKGYFDIVRALVEAGADIESENYQGSTALMWAAANDRPEIVEYLIEKGAEIHKSSSGGAPLDYAKKNDAKRAAEILERAGSGRGEPRCP
jgi:hypothetical protein